MDARRFASQASDLIRASGNLVRYSSAVMLCVALRWRARVAAVWPHNKQETEVDDTLPNLDRDYHAGNLFFY